MLIIPVKSGESIDRALKRFKRKFESTGKMKELRARKQFTKKSVKRRAEIIHATHVQKIKQEEE